MILAVDVQYGDTTRAACLGFSAWESAESTFEAVWTSTEPPAEYEPGEFYKRELPHVVAAFREARRVHPIEAVVVDGHAWLTEGRPGLGARVYEALGGEVPVVGVAKSSFHDGVAIAVRRGGSERPLYVTAAGIDPEQAARLVQGMAGPNRLPTLLKRVDSLARGDVTPDAGKGVSPG